MSLLSQIVRGEEIGKTDGECVEKGAVIHSFEVHSEVDLKARPREQFIQNRLWTFHLLLQLLLGIYPP